MEDVHVRGAPEVDRLVLGINGQVGPRHGRLLMAVAGELGLDSLKLIPMLAEFWLQGPVSEGLAEARLPYAPPGSVASRVAAFESLGLVHESADGSIATDRFRPLLSASVAAREQVVIDTWSGFEDQASGADALAKQVSQAASVDHLVAVAHRELEPATDPLHRFYGRLVTLRYIRQHDHVAAWRAQGLDAVSVSVLTALWNGEIPDSSAAGWPSLERAGLVSGTELTEEGRRVRDAIEADTNRRCASSWAALSPAAGARLVGLLEALPGSPD